MSENTQALEDLILAGALSEAVNGLKESAETAEDVIHRRYEFDVKVSYEAIAPVGSKAGKMSPQESAETLAELLASWVRAGDQPLIIGGVIPEHTYAVTVKGRAEDL